MPLWSGGSRSLPRRRERRRLRDRRQRRQRSVRPITAPARAAGGTLGRRPGQCDFESGRFRDDGPRRPHGGRVPGKAARAVPRACVLPRRHLHVGDCASERTASLPAKSTCCASSTLPGRGSWSPPPTNQRGRRRMSLPRSAACSTRCTSLRRSGGPTFGYGLADALGLASGLASGWIRVSTVPPNRCPPPRCSVSVSVSVALS